MSDENGPSRDVLWKMYQEHCTQGRHHESQRSTVVSAVMAVSAAVIGIVTFDETVSAPTDLPLAFLIIVLGAFGAGFAMKHYERFNLHMERARRHRDALDALLPGRPLIHLKQQADEAHQKKFPRMHKWRLHYWWLTLNLIVTLIGIALFVIAIAFPIKSAAEAFSQDAEGSVGILEVTSAGQPLPQSSEKALTVKFWLQQLMLSALYRDVVFESDLAAWQKHLTAQSRVYCRYPSVASLAIPERRTLTFDEVLLPLDTGTYPSYIYVRRGNAVLRLAKYDPWVFHNLILEAGFPVDPRLSQGVERALF